MTMKLYYWPEVLRDYSAGIAVVLANSADEARAMFTKEHPMNGGDVAGEPEIFELDKPHLFSCWGGG